MNIFGWLRQRRQDRDSARHLYAGLLAQARQPVFYTVGGVPDTTDGRFDMIALHAFIVMQAAPGMNRRMRQYLFDTMFRDFERACREMGIGDLSVPRHMKRMMKAFKGRFFAYQQAAGDHDRLTDALRRNLYRKSEHIDVAALNAMASYVGSSLALVAQVPEDDRRAGRIVFASWEDDLGSRQHAA